MTIYEKLLEVQKELGAIKKDSTNPYFKSKYFDINALLEHVKPVLNKHGLVLTQGLTCVDDANGVSGLGLATRLTESKSGESIETTCPVPVSSDPQKAGSAITYFRRYALQSLLALESEDDDANTASGKKVKTVELNMPPDDDVPF